MIVTLQGTNIFPPKWHFEDDFPFPKVGYVNSLEGMLLENAICCWDLCVFFPVPKSWYNCSWKGHLPLEAHLFTEPTESIFATIKAYRKR